jgi:hypothetical protein
LASGASFPVGVTTNTFRVTDGAGNSTTCSFTVTVNDNQAPNAICQNLTLTLDINGNASTTAGAINNGSSDNCAVSSVSLSASAFTCASAGANTVTLTVTDGSGNTSTCASTVTVLALPVSLSAQPAIAFCGYNITCAGASTGVAIATGTGGCPPYSYSWSSGASTATATGLGAGSHAVTVTDGAGGTAVQTVVLTAPSALMAMATSVPTCTGESDGSIDLTVTGGNDCQGYTFAWSNSATTEDLSNLASGTYTVTMTDAAGCTATQSFTVSALPLPQPTFTQSGNLLTATQTWSSYQWLLNGSNISGANANTYLIVQSGNYALSVTDTNGCVGISAPSVITGIGQEMSQWDDLMLLPNPARDEFRLRSLRPVSIPLRVTLTDMYGKRLFSKMLSSLDYEVSFDIRQLAAGIYWIDVESDAEMRKVFQLIVQ